MLLQYWSNTLKRASRARSMSGAIELFLYSVILYLICIQDFYIRFFAHRPFGDIYLVNPSRKYHFQSPFLYLLDLLLPLHQQSWPQQLMQLPR